MTDQRTTNLASEAHCPTAGSNKSDQLDIHGDSQPLTWDGQPLYSPETVREGLFDPESFEQMPGQLAMEGLAPCPRCSNPCRIVGMDANLHAHCSHCFQGFAVAASNPSSRQSTNKQS